MGAILSAPIRSQLLCRVGDERFRVGGAQMQGFRAQMEDAHTVCLRLPGHEDVAFFGVYDGHSGDQVSHHLAQNLHRHIARHGPTFRDEDLQRAVVEFDLEIGNTQMRNNGSTCVFALVRPQEGDASQWKITVANVGDSRAMLVRADGTLCSLTTDHKPSMREEAARIRQAYGHVQHDRVDGELAMSRAIGDYKYKSDSRLEPLKQKVIALPTITHAVAYSGDRLLVICDGVVERINNEAVARFVHAFHKRCPDDPAEVMRELNLYSLAQGSTDNHSALLVCFEEGTEYSQPDEFIAGPLEAGKNDQAYVAAYMKNAKAWGKSGKELADLIAAANASMPTDWKRHASTRTADRGNWSALLLFAILLLWFFATDSTGLGFRWRAPQNFENTYL